MGAPPLGLRARKKQATATALQECALQLFLEHGYHRTTVQDITDAAGVSQRTFFRYYPTKDAVLLTEHGPREDRIRDLLVGQAGRPVRSAVDTVVAHLAREISLQRDLVTVQTRVFQTVPFLADRFAGHHERLGTILAEHIAREIGSSKDGDPRARLLAGQAIGAWMASVMVWISGDMVADLPVLAADALRVARSDPLLLDC